MNSFQWKVQSAFWRMVAAFVPTCFLQWELSKREGVTATVLGVGDTTTVEAKGPCTVTVNTD